MCVRWCDSPDHGHRPSGTNLRHATKLLVNVTCKETVLMHGGVWELSKYYKEKAYERQSPDYRDATLVYVVDAVTEGCFNSLTTSHNLLQVLLLVLPSCSPTPTCVGLAT